MSRTTPKMFPLCLLISSQTISILSLNRQVKNTSRKHQEGSTVEAVNWAVRHWHTSVSQKWDYLQCEYTHTACLDLISINISLTKKMQRRWKKWTTVTPNGDSSVQIVNCSLVWSFHPYLMIKFNVSLICYTKNVLYL